MSDFADSTPPVASVGSDGKIRIAKLFIYNDRNMLTDFFKLCAEDAEARKYCYQEVALHYAYSKKKGWKKRKRQRKTLVRVQSVLPRDRVGFALRLLLLTRPGPTSYQWLRTVNGVEHNTFAQAAIALNLMESDSLWLRTLQDASNDYKDKQFRRFFAQLMFHSLPSNPEALLAAFIDRLCPVRTDAPDFASRRRRALIRIAYYLQEYNVTLYEVGFDVPRDFSIAEHIEDLQRQDDEEEQQMLTVLENGVPRRRTWQEVAKTERAKLNHDQTAVFERIADAIDNPLNADGSRKQTLFFVTGQGGTGKTFLFNSLISHIRSSNKTYLGTASTGIAALLLRGGRTAHSTFRIANDLTEENTPTINFESRYAEAIRNASMILIDEVSMMNKTVLHYIEKVIKSVHLEPELRDLPFAGKVIILSGDFKQLTPVVVGAGKAGEISASIRKSDLFKKFEHLRLTQNMRLDKNQASFAKWLDELGNGTNIIPNSDGCVQVPEETSVNNLNSLIDFCYPNNCLSDPVKRVDDIKGSSILCTTNNTTFKVNETLLDRLPGKARTFKSIDKPMSDPHKLAVAMALDVHARDYTTEAINSKTPSGLPPHELKLKVGAVVMLIRNLSLRDGLCNGTMLQILEFHGELLRCVNITEGTHQNKEVFIPRTKLVFGTGQYDRCEKFSRIQFPVRLAFAITINKSQGQTLQRVGLYFSGDQCFAHGQLYVAFSRVRHLGAIRILNLAGKDKRLLRNVVYKELLLQ